MSQKKINQDAEKGKGMAWEDDVLKRKEDARYLTKFLVNLYSTARKSHILNINSSWGGGKTYFLKNWKEELQENYPVIYYDAWENDYTSEPLLSFIAEIEEQIKPYVKGGGGNKGLREFTTSAKKLVKPAVPILLSIISKQLAGMSANKLSEAIGGALGESVDKSDVGAIALKAAEAAMDEHNTKKKSISHFKEGLKKIVAAIDEKQEIHAPIFIFIDELDRCRPTFAIELLESIKHLFGVDGIYFVIATDSVQLAHSIRSIYGSEFDSKKYLKRFFDREYQFFDPNYFAFTKYILSTTAVGNNIFFPKLLNEPDPTFLASNIFKFYKSDLRGIQQCLMTLQACSLTAHAGMILHGVYLLHLICLKHYHPDYYSGMKSGVGERFDVYAPRSGMFAMDLRLDTAGEGEHGMFDDRITISVLDIICEYDRFMGRTIPEISTESSNLVTRNIRQQLTSILRNGYQTNNPPRHGFEEYFRMVDRAGRLD